MSGSSSSNETTTTNLQRLSNSIQVEGKDNEGRITVTVRTTDVQPVKTQKLSATQQTQSSTDDTSTPESVLQYQRQLRKVQADQRSIQELSKESHYDPVYQDKNILVVNKPPGVLCVPGLNDKPNLLSLCRRVWLDQEEKNKERKQDDHCDSDNSPPLDSLLQQEPSKMIVHRLDMDTSGLVIFAKTGMAQKALQSKFRDRTDDIVKEYQALVCGHLPLGWTHVDIHLPLQRDHRHPPFMRVATPRSEEEARQAVQDLQTHGFRKLVKKNPKPSHTKMTILKREWLQWNLDAKSGPVATVRESKESNQINSARGLAFLPVTRVKLIPHTGRTHQLRVHMAALGHPILGDPAYGMYGEASPGGGCSGVEQHDEVDVSSSTIGSSLELQEQLQKAWPTPKQPMCLHASKLGMLHPVTQARVEWERKALF